MEFTLSFHTIKDTVLSLLRVARSHFAFTADKKAEYQKLCSLKEPWSRLRSLSDTAYVAGGLWDRDSSVSIVTRLQTVDSAGFGSCQVQEMYLFSKTLKTIYLLVQRVPELFPRGGGLTPHLRLVSRLIICTVKPPWLSDVDRKKFHVLENRRPMLRFSAGEKALLFFTQTRPDHLASYLARSRGLLLRE